MSSGVDPVQVLIVEDVRSGPHSYCVLNGDTHGAPLA
jgi:hypothetical protein